MNQNTTIGSGENELLKSYSWEYKDIGTIQ